MNQGTQMNRLKADAALPPRQDLLLALYHLTLPDGTDIRLAAQLTGTSHIGFAGQTYTSHPARLTALNWRPGLRVMRPVLHLSAAHDQLRQAAAADLLRGARLSRLQTWHTECDPPVGTGGGACFAPDLWQVDRVALLDQDQLKLDLAPLVSLNKRQLPARVMLRDLCQHRYRRYDAAAGRFDYTGVTCPYVGSASFDQSGQPVTDPANDSCSLRLETGCKKRFLAELPYFGFPGLSQ